MNLQKSFLWYKILAYTTGVLLILLVFVAVPLRYIGHHPLMVSILGTAHGYLFIAYLVTAFNLGIRLRWPWLKLGLIMLAGTVPFCSFIAERAAAQDVAVVEQGAKWTS